MTYENTQNGRQALVVCLGPFIFRNRESDNVMKNVIDAESKALWELARGSQRQGKQLKAKVVGGPLKIMIRSIASICFRKIQAEDWRAREALKQESAVLFNASSGTPFPLLVLDDWMMTRVNNAGQLEQTLWNPIYNSVDLGQWVTGSGTLNFPKNLIDCRHDGRESVNYVRMGTEEPVPLRLWFMVVAVKCMLQGVDVLFIVVQDEHLMRSLDGFQHVKALFPSLRSVVVSVAHSDATQMEWSRQVLNIEETGITVQVKMKNIPERKEQKYGGAASSGWAPAMQGLMSLEQFRSVDLSSGSFVANEFLKEFLEALGSQDPGTIVKMYAPNALFSMTAQMAGKTKPIAFYERFDHNLFKNTDETLFEGHEEIEKAYEVIFQEGFACVATSMNANSIEPDRLHFVVLHGVFQPHEQLLFGFDRTLVIEQDGETFVIMNDQLHIRTL